MRQTQSQGHFLDAQLHREGHPARCACQWAAHHFFGFLRATLGRPFNFLPSLIAAADGVGLATEDGAFDAAEADALVDALAGFGFASADEIADRGVSAAIRSIRMFMIFLVNVVAAVR